MLFEKLLVTPASAPIAGKGLYSWGSNGSFATAQGTSTGNTTTPTQSGILTDWAYIAASNFFSSTGNVSLVIKTNGTLWSVGDNTSGATGQGTTSGTTSALTQVGSSGLWKKVSMGGQGGFGRVALGLRTDGTLWSWGENLSGATGQGTTSGTITTPTQVGTDTDWADISAGWTFSLGVKSNGTLWSWGSNANYSTGQNTSSGNLTVPTQVGSATNWAKVFGITYCGFGITTTGQLWSWGLNDHYMTAQGTDAGNTQVPTQVVGLATDWAYIGSGFRTMFALKTTGALYSWGDNTSYGTAQGTNIGDTITPTQVGSSTWISVYGGYPNFANAVKSDNTLWSWGNNADYQTGQGTNTGDTTTPTQVGSATNWSVVASGSGYALALAT